MQASTDNLPVVAVSEPQNMPKKHKTDRLRPKHARFVREYIVDLDATKAAIRSGYSDKTAGQIGWQLLQKTTIQSALAVAQAELAAKSGVTPEKIIQGFAQGAFYDIADFYDKDGNLKNVHDIPKEARSALAGLEVEELYAGNGESRVNIGQVKKVKLVSRHQNLDSLAKHLGLYDADNRQQGKEMVFRVVYEAAAMEGE